MKQSLLILSCLLLSDTCQGCEVNQDVQPKYVKRVAAVNVPMQAMPYKYYSLRDNHADLFIEIPVRQRLELDCPVPTTPPTKKDDDNKECPESARN